MDLYTTIASPAEAVFTEKRSKFLAFAFPVETTDQVKQIVDSVSKKYYDARHVCYAYMIGPERTLFRANDNGEPSGTAGKPILGQINSLNLTNVLVVVVRYFGGIKLGTSGLIAAYRQAAHDALNAATLLECHVTKDISVSFDYEKINDVMKITREKGVKILSQNFDNICSATIRVELDCLPRVNALLSDIDGLIIQE